MLATRPTLLEGSKEFPRRRHTVKQKIDMDKWAIYYQNEDYDIGMSTTYPFNVLFEKRPLEINSEPIKIGETLFFEKGLYHKIGKKDSKYGLIVIIDSTNPNHSLQYIGQFDNHLLFRFHDGIVAQQHQPIDFKDKYLTSYFSLYHNVGHDELIIIRENQTIRVIKP